MKFSAHLFTEAVSIRLEADVPVANFLSGGIDSTAIAKNLHDSSKTINTFSIAITDSKYDESKWSNEVAKRYGTQHKQVNINSDIQDSEIFNSINSLDEPYSDPSVVPSFILSSAISDNYKVALSGDGGDELLGGYKRVSNAFDEFYDVRLKTDDEIVKFSRELKIDIAIDLMCFTKYHKFGIFVKRCAPIQVNYLGYHHTPIYTLHTTIQSFDYIIRHHTLTGNTNPLEKVYCATLRILW